MELTILQIENKIINCKLESGAIINIAQKWFMDGIQEGDIIKFNTHSPKRVIIRRFKGNSHHIATSNRGKWFKPLEMPNMNSQ